MKTKIFAYTLINAMGITSKKIIYSIKDSSITKSIQKLKNEGINSSLIELSETIQEKEKNIVCFKRIKKIYMKIQ